MWLLLAVATASLVVAVSLLIPRRGSAGDVTRMSVAQKVHRAEMAGGSRLVLPSPGTLTLQDVAADGRWLVSVTTSR